MALPRVVEYLFNASFRFRFRLVNVGLSLKGSTLVTPYRQVAQGDMMMLAEAFFSWEVCWISNSLS